jgi:hypothetical protein
LLLLLLKQLLKKLLLPRLPLKKLRLLKHLLRKLLLLKLLLKKLRLLRKLLQMRTKKKRRTDIHKVDLEKTGGKCFPFLLSINYGRRPLWNR